MAAWEARCQLAFATGYSAIESANVAGRPAGSTDHSKRQRGVVRAIKQRAAGHGCSTEAEHRKILREALLEGEEDFAALAEALRGRLRSAADSGSVNRADRRRDEAAWAAMWSTRAWG